MCRFKVKWKRITSSSLTICSSGGVVPAGVAGAGVGVGTRSTGVGAGIGGGGVGVGCACDDSDAFDEEDPGFAGREGCNVLPAAVEEAVGLFWSTTASCAPGVDVPVPPPAALARAAAMRSAWRARAFLRISILLSSSLIFLTKSFTSPGLEKTYKHGRLMMHLVYALEWILEFSKTSVSHLPNLREGCRAK